MSLSNAAIAANRFGLGARNGDLSAIAADPRGWLSEQISSPPRPAIRFASFPPTGDFLRSLPREGRPISDEVKDQAKAMFRVEIAMRLAHQIEAPEGFYERLVRFWSNHFTVSISNPQTEAFAGAFEREVIRPHVTGKFKDMLLAATRHPAMLIYLDNMRSVGPNSPAGRTADRGLNENHAREILELHTLGVDGGYSQSDVIALAEILTGWTISRGPETRGNGFDFAQNRHEPGGKTLLARTYRSSGRGESEGVDALHDIAAHPSTARFVARKLAAHFIADDPPTESVDRLARIYRDTDGDLGEMSLGLIREPAAWTEARVKFKTPEEFVISALRALGRGGGHWAVENLEAVASYIEENGADSFPPDRRTRRRAERRGGGMLEQAMVGGRILISLRDMGQLPFSATSPAGWSDESYTWTNPDSVLERLDWANAVASQIPQPGRPIDLAENLLGPAISEATRFHLEGAETAQQGIGLLLASPEFQRR